MLDWKFGQIALTWPITESSSKAIRVQLPGGEVWLPLHRFERTGISLRKNDQSLTCRISSVFPATIVTLFREFSRSSGEAIVPVKRAGKGPTDKSQKVKVEIWKHDDEETRQRRERTMTIPASQLREIDGKLYLMAWCAWKKLSEGECLVQPFTPAIDAAVKQLEEIVAERVNFYASATDRTTEKSKTFLANAE